MTNKILRCAIYIRVSSVEQKIHGKSLQAQREYLERYASDHGMKVVGIYADEGKTARKEFKKRKEIHHLLEDVKLGKIDIILFWKMDRWFRNVSDFYKVQDILDEFGVKWIAVAEPATNMETRDGRLNLNIMLSIGQNEVDTTSERIKFVNQASINDGKLIFGAKSMPYGITSAVVDGKKIMVIDKEKEPIVREWARYYLLTQSKRATANYIHDNFDDTFTYDRMGTMLRSDLYIGKYKDNPNYVEPYFDKETWEKIKSIGAKNVKTTPSKRIYLFTGLMRCPYCGRALSANTSTRVLYKKTGAKKTYVYYRCVQGEKDKLHKINPLNEARVEKYLLENIKTEFEQYIIKQEEIIEKKKHKPTVNPDKIRKEIERLNYLFQKGRISVDKYESDYDELSTKLNELESVIEIEPVRDFSKLKEILDSDFQEMYENLSRESKQRFWRSIIKEIKIDTKNNVEYIDFL